jgi:endonuclease YncB( thermonuclease family)
MQQATAALAALMAAAAVWPAAAASTKPPRQIAPDIVAPPQFDGKDLQREPARAPLSEIGPAAPPKPKPKKPKEPDANRLFVPLATAAGVMEVQGLTVTIKGIDVVGADEKCSSGGKEWPCGARALTAFRALLRGRAPGCDLPPGIVSGPVTAECWLGKLDIGTWLVSNGWARAAAGGPYVDWGQKAEADRKGIFGTPPTLDGLPAEPPPYAASAANQPILDLSQGAASQGAAVLPAPMPASPQTAPAPATPQTAPTPPVAPQGLY